MDHIPCMSQINSHTLILELAHIRTDILWPDQPMPFKLPHMISQQEQMDKYYSPVPIDILDSPNHHLFIPLLEEYSQSVATYEHVKQKRPPSQEVQGNRLQTSRNYKNINGIVSYQLAQLTAKNEQEVEKYLYRLEEILELEKEIYDQMAMENDLFQQEDSFAVFDRRPRLQSNQIYHYGDTDVIKIEEAMVDIDLSPGEDLDPMDSTTNSREGAEHLNTDSKLKFVELKKLYNILKRKLKRYLEKMKNKVIVDHLHVCKFCGEAYDSGRELGGHMSRKHPGQSQIFKHKTQVHKINQEERNRRRNFKTKRIAKQSPKKGLQVKPAKKVTNNRQVQEESEPYFSSLD